MTAVATTSVMVGAVGAGTASAQQLSRTFGYTCTSFVAGTHSFTAQVTANLPDRVVAGRPGRTIDVNVTVTVNASFTRWLADAGYATVEGTVAASAHVDAPRQQEDLAVPLRMAKTAAPASGPLTIKANGSVTTPTFDHPGRATVTTGGLTLHILARTKAGLWGSTDASCTLDTGRSNVVTSFDITAPGSTNPTGPTGSGGSTAPKPTTRPAGSHTAPKPTTGSVAPAAPDRTAGSVAADAPKPAPPKAAAPAPEPPTAATTPENPSAKPSRAPEAAPAPASPRSAEPVTAAKPPATGLETRDLVLLAVGVLLACAVAFYLGTRRKNSRRTSDDGVDQRPLAPKPDLPATHHRPAIAATRRPRGHGHGTPHPGPTARSVTEGRNLLLGRHTPPRPDHQPTPAHTHEAPDPSVAGRPQ
ncbi:DUF6801 domain-containing protein [Streptomyces laurentii]|uniref:DUF6801 domain-containing protein n=1 Tax=Streptomyces laurentii TaxID=39478 RepID=UPI0036A4DBAD